MSDKPTSRGVSEPALARKNMDMSSTKLESVRHF